LESFSTKLERPISIRKIPINIDALPLKCLMGFFTNNEIPESAGRVPIQKEVSNMPPQRGLFVATAIKTKPYSHPHGNKGLSRPIKKLETE
jgi:hypothetical protein